MKKAFVYVAGALILILVMMIATNSPTDPEPVVTMPEEIPEPPEEFVALKMADVKWPSEKAPEPPKPVKTTKPAPKTKSPPQTTQAGSSQNASGKNSGGYNIIGYFKCSVDAYLHHMRRQGAMVVVYDGTKKRIWELTSSGLILPVEKLTGQFSPQARRLTDDFPDRSRVIGNVTARYGAGNYEILLLMPEQLERRIRSSLENLLKKHIHIPDLTAVHLTYRQEGSVFTATIDWGLVNGKKIPIGKHIRL